jgi:hypothetical protein
VRGGRHHIRIPRVLAAPPPQPGVTAAPAGPLLAPTAGMLPTTGNAHANGPARCISTPRTLRPVRRA